MKTIKSALLGAKNIIDTNPAVIEIQLKEILREHRTLIINRILGDISTYIDYKFQVRPTRELVLKVHDLLIARKNEKIDITNYSAILEMVNTRAVVHLTNEPFFREIDSYLGEHLTQLSATPTAEAGKAGN